MKKALLITCFLLLANTSSFAGEDLDKVGPLDVPSKQFISLYRLTFQPDDISLLDQSAFKFNLSATHSNYWYGSPDYFLDGEISQFNFKVNYGFLSNLEVGTQFRFIWQGGGILDGIIEKFHKLFNFSQAKRDSWVRDDFQFHNWKKYANWEPGFILNDFILTAKVALIPDYLTLKNDLRFPIDSVIKSPGFQSTLQAQVITDIIDLFGSVGFSVHNSEQVFFYKTANVQWNTLFEIRFKPEKNFGILLGFAVSSKPIKKSNIDDFSELAYEFYLGFQWKISDWLFQLAAIENGPTYGNVPDVGFHLSVSYYLD